MSRHILIISLLFACIVGTAFASNETAPDFTLKSNHGKNVKLSDLRGDVVMINFWATWCGPCRQEMPALEALYQEYQDLGFTILGVNVEEDSSKATSMIKDFGISFPVLFDTSSKASKLYDVSTMPSTVLVDRDGKIRYLHRGYKSGYEDSYQTQIRELIRE
ncbi:MAG: TlpA disulfide reductase family protein [Gammaproteobacteria bacterium]